MKKFLNLFTAILFISTAILMSCGGTDDDTPVDQQNITGGFMTTGTATPSSVTVNDGAGSVTVTDDWSNFSLTFTYDSDTKAGTYVTSGVPEASGTTVWATSGTWAFDGDKTDTIIRDGDSSKPVSLSANATAMTLGFNVVDAGRPGRVLTFGGDWTFALSF